MVIPFIATKLLSSSSTASSLPTTTTTTTTTDTSTKNPTIGTSLERQELVGNRKVFRIERNKIYLKIIGNGNKITLKNNTGILEIVGNSTRVKVIQNAGKVQFTGNQGKIYIGSDSPNKNVKYTGNGGILKLVDKELLIQRQSSMTSSGDDDEDPIDNCDKFQLNTKNKPENKSKKQSSKKHHHHYHQQGNDGSSDENNIKYTKKTYVNSNCDYIHVKNNISLPNLDVIDNLRFDSRIKIANSTGNIVINNTFKL